MQKLVVVSVYRKSQEPKEVAIRVVKENEQHCIFVVLDEPADTAEIRNASQDAERFYCEVIINQRYTIPVSIPPFNGEQVPAEYDEVVDVFVFLSGNILAGQEFCFEAEIDLCI